MFPFCICMLINWILTSYTESSSGEKNLNWRRIYLCSPYSATSGNHHLFLILRSCFYSIVFQLQEALPLFISIAKNARVPGVHSGSFLKTLDKIIPNEYFGFFKNRKAFYKIVKTILSQSRYECVYTSALVRRFNLRQIPWLANVLEESAKKVYFQKVSSHYTIPAWYYTY